MKKEDKQEAELHTMTNVSQNQKETLPKEETAVEKKERQQEAEKNNMQATDITKTTMTLQAEDDGKGKKKKKKEKAPKTPMDKKKKKKVIRRCMIGGIAAVVIFFMVGNSMRAKNAGMMVHTTAVTREDVEQVLSTGGTVKSEETKTYFAPVAVQIGQVDVAVGDSVEKGQQLLAYDESALTDAKQVAELKLQANEGGYDSSMYKDGKYRAELNEANVNLEVLEQQIADNENYLKELKKKVEDKKAWYANQGAQLQVSLLEWEKKISDEKQALAERNEEELKRGEDGEEKKEKDEAAKGQISADEEVYLNLQSQVQLNSYEQQNNKEIRDLEREIEACEELIAGYKEYRSEMKAQKDSSESGAMDKGSRSQLEANTEMEKINGQETLTSISEVEKGILADYNGVVTELTAVEGATPQEGEKLLTLESTEKVKVEITVSKYDLEKIALGQEAQIDIAGKIYNGKVTKINRMATNNASGAAVVGVEIGIENPDNSIFLGVEAKVEIHTAEAAGVVAIPLELVNTDMEGDFVFVAENGVAVKRRITTGISSDLYIEIKEGLSEGEAVIATTGQELEEGTAVTAVAQQ